MAYSLNLLDRYCKAYILSNYFAVYLLALSNPRERKRNFLLKKSMYCRNEDSNIYGVLNPSYKSNAATPLG
jgi:hypothetical protein